MLISYYANKKKFPKVAVVATKLNFFNIPIESGSIIKPCTLKHFQVTYSLHKAGYWTRMFIKFTPKQTEQPWHGWSLYVIVYDYA